jgi:mRNA interferase MazF
MIKISRGDVFFADLFGAGSMQSGRRPVIIVSNNKANKHSKTVTVVPVTSSETKAKLPTHVEFDGQSKTHNLKGIALGECINTIDKTLLREKVGYCSAKEMFKINVAILIQVGINIFELISDCTVDMFKCLIKGK